MKIAAKRIGAKQMRLALQSAEEEKDNADKWIAVKWSVLYGSFVGQNANWCCCNSTEVNQC